MWQKQFKSSSNYLCFLWNLCLILTMASWTFAEASIVFVNGILNLCVGIDRLYQWHPKPFGKACLFLTKASETFRKGLIVFVNGIRNLSEGFDCFWQRLPKPFGRVWLFLTKASETILVVFLGKTVLWQTARSLRRSARDWNEKPTAPLLRGARTWRGKPDPRFSRGMRPKNNATKVGNY